MTDIKNQWYEENIRGLDITVEQNTNLIDVLWDPVHKDERLFKDKTDFVFFALVVAIHKGKKPQYYEKGGGITHELRSEWGITDQRLMIVKLVTHKFPKPINKMDVAVIDLKCVSSLVQQGLDIVIGELKSEINWSRVGNLIYNEKFFEIINYDYNK
ncbi:hypothetical protein N9A38_02855 [Gammaproteobacteria bacterium]|nr:hypothetical protein [Gammaproteobacteria bacterium]